MRTKLTVCGGFLCLVAHAVSSREATTALDITAPIVHRIQGTHASTSQAASWVIEKPDNWNGTLLLYAHGYSPVVSASPPETAPREVREWLLAHGYALAASSFTAGGWALAEAPRDQMEVLDQFVARVGTPRRTIAWGSSMGGLVTLALAERNPERIHAALSLCGSVSGSLGMLNTALDGAFAFRTLVVPESAIRVVDIDDDRVNSARVAAALNSAWTTPEGRARVVLAAALAQLPAWSDPATARPAANDYTAQAEQLRRTFVMGVFVPRVDQEQRAGGIYSWNTGVDYAQLLRQSPLRALVRHFYREAGMDLEADLQRLNAAPRIEAQASAVAYLRANFVPRGDWRVPVLTLQTQGDGLTVPATHGGLAQTTRAAGGKRMLRQLWLARAGHCVFSGAELAGALATLEHRLVTGRWSLSPAKVAARGKAASGETRFIRYTAPPMPRQCGARRGSCLGEPK